MWKCVNHLCRFCCSAITPAYNLSEKPWRYIPGTKCIANAYTNNHELLASGELGMFESLYLHMVDAVGIVHSVILRIQTMILPVKMLVFAGH
ncbi:MAG: hypothetical protein KAJ95_03555 [Gammaproteobacteria bacterium]|nr:hypothetical protein [Gammaproteobacteria bacterium]